MSPLPRPTYIVSSGDGKGRKLEELSLTKQLKKKKVRGFHVCCWRLDKICIGKEHSLHHMLYYGFCVRYKFRICVMDMSRLWSFFSNSSLTFSVVFIGIAGLDRLTCGPGHFPPAQYYADSPQLNPLTSMGNSCTTDESAFQLSC